MKLVLHYRASRGFEEIARAALPPGSTLTIVPETDDQMFAAAMAQADVLFHCLRPIGAADLALAPRLKLIQKIGVGVNTIDLDAARAQGVSVCNMPGTNSAAVVELTLGLILSALRQIPWLDQQMRKGNGWPVPENDFDQTGEINGRVVGLLGYGEIPKRLTPVLRALGADVIYHARTKRADDDATYVSLEELVARSDILSLHVPLTAETQGMFDRARLGRMKAGAILINTARGGLVDEDALYDALQSGHLRAAGLDVFANEPIKPDNRLLGLSQVIVSPHIAWLTPETLRRSMVVAMDNCQRLSRGEPLRHQIV